MKLATTIALLLFASQASAAPIPMPDPPTPLSEELIDIEQVNVLEDYWSHVPSGRDRCAVLLPPSPVSTSHKSPVDRCIPNTRPQWPSERRWTGPPPFTMVHLPTPGTGLWERPPRRPADAIAAAPRSLLIFIGGGGGSSSEEHHHHYHEAPPPPPVTPPATPPVEVIPLPAGGLLLSTALLGLLLVRRASWKT